MNDLYNVEVVAGATRKVLASLETAILSTMEAASSGMAAQATAAKSLETLNAQESVLNWLVERRAQQETRLNDERLRPVQKAFVERTLAQIDAEIAVLLKAAGVETKQTVKLPAKIKDRTQSVPPSRNGHR